MPCHRLRGATTRGEGGAILRADRGSDKTTGCGLRRLNDEQNTSQNTNEKINASCTLTVLPGHVTASRVMSRLCTTATLHQCSHRVHKSRVACHGCTHSRYNCPAAFRRKQKEFVQLLGSMALPAIRGSSPKFPEGLRCRARSIAMTAASAQWHHGRCESSMMLSTSYILS